MRRRIHHIHLAGCLRRASPSRPVLRAGGEVDAQLSSAPPGGARSAAAAGRNSDDRHVQ